MKYVFIIVIGWMSLGLGFFPKKSEFDFDETTWVRHVTGVPGHTLDYKFPANAWYLRPLLNEARFIDSEPTGGDWLPFVDIGYGYKKKGDGFPDFIITFNLHRFESPLKSSYSIDALGEYIEKNTRYIECPKTGERYYKGDKVTVKRIGANTFVHLESKDMDKEKEIKVGAAIAFLTPTDHYYYVLDENHFLRFSFEYHDKKRLGTRWQRDMRRAAEAVMRNVSIIDLE